MHACLENDYANAIKPIHYLMVWLIYVTCINVMLCRCAHLFLPVASLLLSETGMALLILSQPISYKYEPRNEISNNWACATSKVSD